MRLEIKPRATLRLTRFPLSCAPGLLLHAFNDDTVKFLVVTVFL